MLYFNRVPEIKIVILFNKNIFYLKHTSEYVVLKDMYETFHPRKIEYTFSSDTHRRIPWLNHIKRDITNITNLKRLKSFMFSNHKGTKLKINDKTKLENLQHKY